MQSKILKLSVTFVVLFSLQGFSQTTDKSQHPLLDKYYPQKQNPNAIKTVTTRAKSAPETNHVPEAKPVSAKPVAKTNQVSETKPVYKTKQKPALANTTVINKSSNYTSPVPVQKEVQTKPAAIPMRDTRLGSSSPLYDTYEKNNNGAGSVTTSPK